jgi:PAS domain S-box-containing protein
VIAWNRAVEEMTGVPAREVLGRGDHAYAIPLYGERRSILIDLVNTPDDAVPDLYTNVHRVGDSIMAETELPGTNGDRIAVLAKACPLYNREGERVGAIESVRDISERKRLETDLAGKHAELQVSYEQLAAAEEELRGQFEELAGSEQRIRTHEQRLAMAQEIGRTGSWEYNLSTNEIWGSSEGLRIFGYPAIAGTFPIEDIEACIPERERVHRALVDLIEEGREYNLEYLIHPADGSESRVIHSVARLERDPEGRPSRVVGVIQDITERWRAEEETAFRNLVLSTQQETSLDGILIVDEEEKVLHSNRKFREIWGISDDLAAAGSDTEFLKHVVGLVADPEAFLARIRYLYEHRDERSFEELWLKDGRVFERFSAPMVGAQGRYFGRVWYFRDITSRTRLEQARRETESFLISVIEQSPNPIWISDETGMLIRMNQACRELLRISDEDVVGIYSIFDDNIVKEQGFMPLVERVFETGEPARFELVYDSAQLTGLALPRTVRRILDVSIFAIRDLDGRVTNAVIQHTDISEWRRSADALRMSELRFRSLIQNSSDMIRIIDRDGLIAYTSPSTERLFGYDPGALIGRDPLEFVHPDDREEVRGALGAVFDRTNPGTPTEYRIRHADGHYVPVEAVAVNLIGTPGIDGIITTTRPIAERKRAAAALAESEKKFRTIFERSPYPIAINRLPDYAFLEVNPAFLTVGGYDEIEVLGRSPVDLGLLPRSEVLRLISEQPQGPPIENLPLVLTTKDGRQIHVLISAMPITIDNGPAVVTLAAEVTALKRVEEDLLRTNEDLTRAIEDLRSTEEELQQQLEEIRAQGEAIRASEEKFRVVVELSLDGILIADFQGNVLFANRAATEIVDMPGYDPLQETSNVLDLVAPESRDDVLRDFANVAVGIETYLAHYQLVTMTGREVWVECVGKRIPFEGASAILVSLRDVTERRRAEMQLRESEQKFTTIFEHSPVPLTLVSATDGCFINVNDAFLRNTGYPRDEVIGRTAEALGLFADEQEYGRFVSALREERTVLGLELRCRTRSGEVRLCRFSSGIIMMGGGPHILSLVEDITDRKRIEEALRESDLRFKTLFENANDAITVVGMEPDGRPSMFLNVNENTCRLTGYTRDELLSMSPMELEDPEIWRDARRFSKQLMEQGDLVFERIQVRKDGQKLPVEISAHVFVMEGRRVIISIIRDITERKRAEDALRQANRKLNILSGITRHDIKDQLLTLNGFVALLRRDLSDDAFDRYLSRIKGASGQIANMIQFTKVYEQVGVRAPVWQNVRDLVDLAARDISLGEVVLTNDLPPTTGLFADPLIVKVFFNLVDNALRHGGTVTAIRFSCEVRDDDLVIVCEDDGTGVAQEEKERIFDRGFGHNTGFGLAISREILDITGLGIRETGEAGRGARFEVTVPRQAYRTG